MDAAGFLRSRPQIAALEKSHVSTREKSGPVVKANEATDVLRNDIVGHNAASKQRNESIDEFLRRLPVAAPETAAVGPWLWVHSPRLEAGQGKHHEGADIEGFVKVAFDLLHAFRKRRSSIEAANLSRKPATVTRKMGPYRDQLEEDLLSAAVQHSITCGKWMLFPDSTDLARFWRLVAEATSQGSLGPISKVGTPDPSGMKSSTLICVYTYNFTDVDDVRRVLNELLRLGLCTRDGKPVYYKCDAYTYLDITSDNSYKLRASLFSSVEILAKEAKMLKEGPVARLRKKNNTIDSFLAS